MRGHGSSLGVDEDGEDGSEGGRRVSSVMITPINTLERSEQQHLELGSSGSSDDESNDLFRDKKHRSLVLKRVSEASMILLLLCVCVCVCVCVCEILNHLSLQCINACVCVCVCCQLYALHNIGQEKESCLFSITRRHGATQPSCRP